MIKLTVSEYQALRDKYLETKGLVGDVKTMEAFGVGFIQALNWLWDNHQIETKIILDGED